MGALVWTTSREEPWFATGIHDGLKGLLQPSPETPNPPCVHHDSRVTGKR